MIVQPSQVFGLNPWQILSLMVTRFWWVFLVFAIFSWIMAQRMMRSISILAVYHRKGVAAENYRATLQGQVLSFIPKKGTLFARKSPIDVVRVTVDADPEIQVVGLRTYSVHHIIEGYSRTVNIRQIPILLAKLYQAQVGVPLLSGLAGTSVATSLSTMQSAFSTMGGSYPKTKGEYIMNAIYAIAGLGWGVVIGFFAARGK